jgi:hypothetical protein
VYKLKICILQKFDIPAIPVELLEKNESPMEIGLKRTIQHYSSIRQNREKKSVINNKI